MRLANPAEILDIGKQVAGTSPAMTYEGIIGGKRNHRVIEACKIGSHISRKS
jgi:hypothetical protein